MWKHVTPSLSRLLVLDSKGRSGLFTTPVISTYDEDGRRGLRGFQGLGKGEHTLTLHSTQSESRIHTVHSNTVITLTHVQPRRLQGRSIRGRWRQMSESGTPGEHEGLSRATLTLLSEEHRSDQALSTVGVHEPWWATGGCAEQVKAGGAMADQKSTASQDSHWQVMTISHCVTHTHTHE